MAKPTIRDRLIVGLERDGARRVQYFSRKYDVFKSANTPDLLLFVGKAGALRAGSNISDSTPVLEAYRRKLLS